MASKGKLARITGPVVVAKGLTDSKLYDVVKVGDEKLIGEIIKIVGNEYVVQVYEDTSGLKPGEPVLGTGEPLSVELGPGILKSFYDGIQRPLNLIEEKAGTYITRGIEVPALDRKKKWDFKALKKKGEKVVQGDVLGEVQETSLITHRILSPFDGKLTDLKSGKYTVEEIIGSIEHMGKKKPLMLHHRWVVRKARPYKEKFPPVVPLSTGMRIVDTFFPIAKGGTACIPGPFGSGKCVAGDTPVLLGDGSLTTMQKLYEETKKGGTNSVEDNGMEELIHTGTPIPLFSFNHSKISKSSSTLVYHGMSDTLIKVKTRSGRSVEITPVHRLFVIDENGEIKERMARDLEQGDFVIAPRKIEGEFEDAEIDIYQLGNARVVDDEIRIEVSELLKEGRKKGVVFDLSLFTLKNLRSKSVTPKLEWIREIYSKMSLPLPIPKLVRGDRFGNGITIPSKVNRELAEFIGMFVAEGYARGNRTLVFTNNDGGIAHRFITLAHSLFGVKPKVEKQKGKATNILIQSKTLVDFVRMLSLGKNAETKRVPAILMRSSNESVEGFLSGYFICDGSFSGGDIEFSTASKELSIQLSYLLARFGILHSISEKVKKYNKRKQYRVFIRSIENLKLFSELAGVEHRKFASILSYVHSKKSRYSAVDVVPISPEVVGRIYREIGSPYKQLKDMGIEIHNYIGNKEKMGTSIFKKYAEFAQKRCGTQKQLFSIAKLAEALDYIFCDEIVEIEERVGPFDVFDVSLPGIENFIGGFGGLLLHNTVTQQSLAKWSDAEIVVYVGCGERGNEMTEVLNEFPKLIDPKSGKPLMERTVLIANTSNMPVAAREASIYTGITLAEYYRDQGYGVSLMADSTSRWAEALREISGRLEEMPGEEGYPAYLARKLAEFYERAGRIRCLGSDERYGSVTAIGAVSPPGGDISEPVSQNTLRVTKVFLALDASLAHRRHFPAFNWLNSYSLYTETLDPYYEEEISSEWPKLRNNAMALLQKEAELQEVVQLVGPDALPEKEQEILITAKMIREDFLQQSAFHEVDTYSSMKKQYLMLKNIMKFHDRASAAVDLGVQLKNVSATKVKERIGRMKEIPEDKIKDIENIGKEVDSEFDALIKAR